MAKTVRRCLGCGATYPPDEPACPKCGSHAADLDQVEEKGAEAKPKSARRRT
jgi:rRNA maturation endonuclease Nob1